jgi:hypothetical protein
MVAHFQPVGRHEQLVQPYFANLYAVSLCRHGRHLDEVARYIDWYLDHLNEGGRDGPAGTIDDYVVHHGTRERSEGMYDSADGYAGTFLLLLDAYERASGDAGLIASRLDDIRTVAGLLLSLQDEDGLVRVSPDDGTHYLMDNCEAYGGLVAWAAVERRLGHPECRRYETAAERLRRAIMARLYDPVARRFLWAESDAALHASSWDTYYPDALAQLFPVLYGVVPSGEELAGSLWREFAARYDPRAGDATSPHERTLIELTRERVTR